VNSKIDPKVAKAKPEGEWEVEGPHEKEETPTQSVNDWRILPILVLEDKQKDDSRSVKQKEHNVDVEVILLDIGAIPLLNTRWNWTITLTN